MICQRLVSVRSVLLLRYAQECDSVVAVNMRRITGGKALRHQNEDEVYPHTHNSGVKGFRQVRMCWRVRAALC